MSILCYTKYKSYPRHKTVYNYAMPHLMILIMIGLKFFKDQNNNQINPWAKYNSIRLDKMMINMWNKCALDLRQREPWLVLTTHFIDM